MKAHTEYATLDGLDKLVHDQRRKVAGALRIQQEDHALRDKMAEQLQAAGVDAVTVTIGLGTFEVRLARARAGNIYATVTKLPDGAPEGDAPQ